MADRQARGDDWETIGRLVEQVIDYGLSNLPGVILTGVPKELGNVRV